jgi:hypothetical protein
MNSWKAIVVKHKARSVKPIPAGWLTKSEVAEKLGCPECRVTENLRAAIAAREVVTKKFQVWDKVESRVMTVTCYSIKHSKQSSDQSEQPKRKPGRWPFPVGTKVRRDDGTMVGVVIPNKGIRWENGKIGFPKGSTTRKIICA